MYRNSKTLKRCVSKLFYVWKYLTKDKVENKKYTRYSKYKGLKCLVSTNELWFKLHDVTVLSKNED